MDKWEDSELEVTPSMLLEVLNKQGLEGWELASIYYTQSIAHAMKVVFKRRLSS